MKTRIYKVRVEIADDGRIKATSYCNRLLGMLVNEFNNAIQEKVNQLNGDAAWKQSFICFGHEGQVYHQVLQEEGKYCDGCVFKEHKNGVSCQHPHYLDGTKGNCEGKIYKKGGF